jgi:hypothetical protein
MCILSTFYIKYNCNLNRKLIKSFLITNNFMVSITYISLDNICEWTWENYSITQMLRHHNGYISWSCLHGQGIKNLNHYFGSNTNKCCYLGINFSETQFLILSKEIWVGFWFSSFFPFLSWSEENFLQILSYKEPQYKKQITLKCLG